MRRLILVFAAGRPFQLHPQTLGGLQRLAGKQARGKRSAGRRRLAADHGGSHGGKTQFIFKSQT